MLKPIVFAKNVNSSAAHFVSLVIQNCTELCIGNVIVRENLYFNISSGRAVSVRASDVGLFCIFNESNGSKVC